MPLSVFTTSQLTSPRPGLLLVGAVLTAPQTLPLLLSIDAATGTINALQPGLTIQDRPVSAGGISHFPASRAPGVIACASDGVTTIPITAPVGQGQPARFLGAASGSVWLTTIDGHLLRIPIGASNAIVVGPTERAPELRSPLLVGNTFYFVSGRGTLVEVDTVNGVSRTLREDVTPLNRSLNELALQSNGILFGGRFEERGEELLRYDLGTRDVGLLANINTAGSQIVDSDPRGFIRFGERAVFAEASSFAGREPWITDGTAAGTQPLGRLQLDQAIRSYDYLTVADELWIVPRPVSTFLARTTVHVSDGTPAGTRPLVDLTGLTAPIQATAALGDAMILVGTVGRTSGVYRIYRPRNVDLLARTSGSAAIIETVGELAFIAQVGGNDAEVWRTDGTPAGTTRLDGARLATGQLSLEVFDDRLYVGAGNGIFVSDAGATTLTQVDTLAARRLVAADDRLFAFGVSELGALRRGSTKFAKFRAPGLIAVDTATARGDRALFVAEEVAYATDGTAAGTVALLPPSFRVESTVGAFVVSAPDRAFFAAVDRQSARTGLYVTDGTPTGTRRLEDLGIVPSTSRSVSALTSGIVAGRLYLQVNGPEGREPWVVDLKAAAEIVGDSCTAAARRIHLDVDRSPVLGRIFAIRGSAPTANAAALLFGSPALRPVPLPPPGGCSVQLQPFGAVTTPAVPAPGGSFSVPLAPPSTPVLRGFEVTVHAVFAPASAPGRLDVSPGLRLRLDD